MVEVNEAAEHETDPGNGDHGLGDLGQLLVVLGEAASSVQARRLAAPMQQELVFRPRRMIPMSWNWGARLMRKSSRYVGYHLFRSEHSYVRCQEARQQLAHYRTSAR